MELITVQWVENTVKGSPVYCTRGLTVHAFIGIIQQIRFHTWEGRVQKYIDVIYQQNILTMLKCHQIAGCDCDPVGTKGDHTICNKTTGQCDCIDNIAGRQ